MRETKGMPLRAGMLAIIALALAGCMQSGISEK
jgi:hypothetical protein